jgi:hypothetical protein
MFMGYCVAGLSEQDFIAMATMPFIGFAFLQLYLMH